MSKISDKIEKAIKSEELKEQFKDVEPLKQKLETWKNHNKEEYSSEEIPKITVIQIPMMNIDLDKLEELSIDYLRDLHFQVFGKKAPRITGIGKEWISNKIRASFKTK